MDKIYEIQQSISMYVLLQYKRNKTHKTGHDFQNSERF